MKSETIIYGFLVGRLCLDETLCPFSAFQQITRTNCTKTVWEHGSAIKCSVVSTQLLQTKFGVWQERAIFQKFGYFKRLS